MKGHQGTQSRGFSSKVLYTTQQEADIHGIAFGQRLIDGKAEGRSIADMKTTDRRAAPRFRVQFHTTFMFSASTKQKGIGVMLDLSMGECRIESLVTVEPDESLVPWIYAPAVGWPLMIEAASVQWVSGEIFGLAFFRITETEQQRLGQLISELMADS